MAHLIVRNRAKDDVEGLVDCLNLVYDYVRQTPHVFIMALLKSSSKIATLFRPFEIPCNIFGVTVTSFSHRKLTNLLSCAYTLLHLTLSTMLTLYRIGNVEPQFCQPNAISQSVNGIQQILGLAVMLSIYYQTLFRKADVQRVLKLLQQSDQQLVQLNAILKQKAFGVKIVIEAVVVVLYAYGAFVLFAVRYNVTSVRLLVVEFISAINPLVLTHLVLLMFVNLCWHVRNKFQKLKIILREIVDNNNKQQSGKDAVWTVQTPNGSARVVFQQVQLIAKTYETLFDTVNMLNRIFGLSNLTSIGEYRFCSSAKSEQKLRDKFVSSIL